MSLFSDAEMGVKPEYQVLARKYRPRTFRDMVGQEVLVKTFTNAIDKNRIAHAFILTGIRGVGKTTTARIIARALNCTGADGTSGITIDPCGVCSSCVSILEDRNQDVIEIDAASHTGVDDIREIIESARYKPVSARYKVFIIDEVHMLSNNAFNALLKTLEEPPAYVKFIFATTEIRKIPVTILSRCQRFDLKRVDLETLVDHFEKILAVEGFKAEHDAIKLIANVAAGSVRDGLSILDQAIANSEGLISENQVREMLGLADISLMLELYASLAKADQTTALNLLKDLHDKGADPIYLAQELLNLNHMVLKARVAPNSISHFAEVERNKIGQLAQQMEVSMLSRFHSIIVKTIEEIKVSHIPQKSLEVAVIKLCYLSTLPSLEDLITQTPTASRAQEVQPHKINITNFNDLLAALNHNQEEFLASQISQYTGFVKIEGSSLHLSVKPDAPKDIFPKLASALKTITSSNWQIVRSEQEAKTLLEEEREKLKSYEQSVIADAGVQEILSAFPGAEIAEITNKKIG